MSQSSDYELLNLSSQISRQSNIPAENELPSQISQLSSLQDTDSREFDHHAQLPSQPSILINHDDSNSKVNDDEVNIWSPFSEFQSQYQSVPISPTQRMSPSASSAAPTEIMSPSASSAAPTEIMSPSASSVARRRATVISPPSSAAPTEIISPSASSAARRRANFMSASESSQSIHQHREISETVTEHALQLEMRLRRSGAMAILHTPESDDDNHGKNRKGNKIPHAKMEAIDLDEDRDSDVEGMNVDAFDALRDSQGLLSPGQLPNTDFLEEEARKDMSLRTNVNSQHMN